MKPHLACDWDESKVRFPIIAQPKIDGVRGINLTGALTGRSLKRHENLHVSELFTDPCLAGLDGELAAAHAQDPDLCRKTTSALSTINSTPYVVWWLFDYLASHTISMPYYMRLNELHSRVRLLQDHPDQVPAVSRLRIVESERVEDMGHLLGLEETWLNEGYEGVILRDPNGMHKNGRCTPREGAYLRIKRFVEEEAIVQRVVEGQSNGNEATINELGRTERSTHQENMTPNGMVGALECIDCKTSKPITVSAGSMPHPDRIRYCLDPSLLLGKKIKYKTFPKGVKDKPRFPTFVAIKLDSDV